MVRRNFGGLSAAKARGGFTLVELLVVIIIIAILAAIAVPAVMRATATAQNARIKTEIDMLHMAIQQYKNEYGSYPPAVDVVGAGGPLHKHLQRLFPRISPNYLPSVRQVGLMKPDNAIVGWLLGYTDDPTNPAGLMPGGDSGDTSMQKKKLFDFDASRVSAGRYAPPSKPKSPYSYIPSSVYTTGSGSSTTVPVFSFPDLNYRAPYAGYFAHRVPAASAPNDFALLSQPAFNADTFQILCAGRDEIFGTDDDLSNFWPGTRKDYLDSPK